jgi:hypothetical protein
MRRGEYLFTYSLSNFNFDLYFKHRTRIPANEMEENMMTITNEVSSPEYPRKYPDTVIISIPMINFIMFNPGDLKFLNGKSDPIMKAVAM